MCTEEERAGRELKPILNRDIPALSNLLYIVQEVEGTEQKRMWQQDRLWNITRKITGMTGGGGGEPGGIDANFAAICELEEEYDRQIAQYTAEMQRVKSILDAIPSQTMRVFVDMRYVRNLSRREIMDKLGLKRWKYHAFCERIEQAADMAHVNWAEEG